MKNNINSSTHDDPWCPGGGCTGPSESGGTAEGNQLWLICLLHPAGILRWEPGEGKKDSGPDYLHYDKLYFLLWPRSIGLAMTIRHPFGFLFSCWDIKQYGCNILRSIYSISSSPRGARNIEKCNISRLLYGISNILGAPDLKYIGELLFSSVCPLTLNYGHWLGFSSNMYHILAQHMFRVHLDLYAPDLSKSTSKYLLFKKGVRKHGSRCFTAI